MAELNVANRTLFHGDNLPFLRGINSGTVQLTATDPPFNKNKDFHATPDSVAAGAQFQDPTEQRRRALCITQIANFCSKLAKPYW